MPQLYQDYQCACASLIGGIISWQAQGQDSQGRRNRTDVRLDARSALSAACFSDLKEAE